MAGMMPVRGLCATPMSQVESELRRVPFDQTNGLPLSWRNAVGVYQIWTNQSADDPNAFLNEIDGSAMQFQLVAPTDITSEVEGPAISDQSTHFIDPGANCYHRCTVAPS
ncbi:hypothetical protein [Sphingomonas sp. CFBP9019]|uniref:hypothetical protein n=1 Tax=Sphingomonas sp. CFBP9019 TaxID=3096532 RepID=UPI003BEF16B1